MCRAAEYAAQLRLAEVHRIAPPYRVAEWQGLIAAHSTRRDGELVIRQRFAFDALRQLNDGLVRAWTVDLEMRMERRKDTVLSHGLAAADAGEVGIEPHDEGGLASAFPKPIKVMDLETPTIHPADSTIDSLISLA